MYGYRGDKLASISIVGSVLTESWVVYPCCSQQGNANTLSMSRATGGTEVNLLSQRRARIQADKMSVLGQVKSSGDR